MNRDGPAGDRKATVLVADDHQPSRVGVAMALSAGGFDVVAELASGPAAVAAALRTRPDLCLLDIHMPGGGIEAATAITASLPRTFVVMLTADDGDESLFRALRAGAVGYLLKDTNPGRLTAVLSGVLKGEAALPRALMGRVVQEFRSLAPAAATRHRAGHAGLTGREWEIMTMLRSGMTTIQIADRVSLAPVTVRRHISTAVAKLGAGSRGEAVRRVEELAG